jgi:DNA-binding XRE family transcriptional regulator
MQVDPVQQRTGQPVPVFLDLLRCASAFTTEQDNSTPNLRRLSEALRVSIAYLGCFESLPEHTLGQRIKKARLYHGYNKREFAKKIGVSTRMIWLWEKDEYRSSEKNMERLDTFLAILN